MAAIVTGIGFALIAAVTLFVFPNVLGAGIAPLLAFGLTFAWCFYRAHTKLKNRRARVPSQSAGRTTVRNR